MTENLDQYRDWDAAYVLGALSADDRRAFERHLANCPDCTRAVAELAGMPGILSVLSAEHAVALANTPEDTRLRNEQRAPELVRGLAHAAATGRRRGRRRMIGVAVGAAALFTVGGIVIGTALTPATAPVAAPTGSSEPSTESSMLAMSQVEPGTITANLQLTEKKWGTRFDWTCDYPGASGTEGSDNDRAIYSLVITDAAGVETVIATWRAAGTRAAGLAAASDVATADIRSVEIRLEQRPLVRTEL